MPFSLHHLLFFLPILPPLLYLQPAEYSRYFIWHKAWVESETRAAGENAFSRSALASRISSLP